MKLYKLYEQVLSEGMLKEIFAYHGSPNNIDKFIFKPVNWNEIKGSPEYGFHFGSLEAAKMRMLHKGIDGFMYKVELDIKNPLRLKEGRNDGGWNPFFIVKKIIEKTNLATQEEIDSWYTGGKEGSLVNSKGIDWFEVANNEDYTFEDQGKWMEQWLLDKGYDGIVYDNEFEGGGDSYLVFNTDLINIVDKKPYDINKNTLISDLPLPDLVIKAINDNGIKRISDLDGLSGDDFNEILNKIKNKDESIAIKKWIESLIRKLTNLDIINVKKIEYTPPKKKEINVILDKGQREVLNNALMVINNINNSGKDFKKEIDAGYGPNGSNGVTFKIKNKEQGDFDVKLEVRVVPKELKGTKQDLPYRLTVSKGYKGDVDYFKNFDELINFIKTIKLTDYVKGDDSPSSKDTVYEKITRLLKSGDKDNIDLAFVIAKNQGINPDSLNKLLKLYQK
jgi:hypothetical protein